MTDWKLPWDGGCRCDRVRLRITAAPLITLCCHCRGCQRMSASAYSLSVAIPAEGFSLVQGTPVIGGLHGATRHFFCEYCMSWLFTRPEGFDWFVNVRAPSLDDASWYVPFVETFTSERLPWAQTPAPYRYEKLPADDLWPWLVDEFGRWVAAAANG